MMQNETITNVRKVARDAPSLSDRGELLQAALDNLADGVIVAGQDGVLVYSNPAAQRLNGHSLASRRLDEWTKNFSFYLPDKTTPLPEDNLPWARALRGEEASVPESFLVNLHNPQGIWLSASAKTLKTSSGVPCGCIIVFHDLTERKQIEQHLTHLAQYDPLTGLPNRNLLNDRLTQAEARAKRNQQSMALMFLDLDNFKDINDSLGHWLGDLVLKGVAGRLAACLRDGDSIARLGGDEFAILLEGVTQSAHVTAVADKILAALKQPFLLEGHEVFITTSIGIARYPSDAEGEVIDIMLKKADIAMYRAKDLGRNNYQFYSPRMHISSLKK